MKLIRMYTGADKRTHLEEMPLPTKPDRAGVQTAELEPATGRPHMRIGTATMPNLHTAPRRQYLVIVEGRIDVLGGDGAKKTLETGDILLAEDLEGEGHLVRMNGCKRWVAFIVPIAG